MIKRPKPTDTEEDILQMQNEFLKDQTKNAQFQPAAKLVKVQPGKFFVPQYFINNSIESMIHFI